jgi:hypothetical protein
MELNNRCSKWINKHVEKNSLKHLTPIFIDYFNYLIQLENKFMKNQTSVRNNITLENKLKVPNPAPLPEFSPAVVHSNSIEMNLRDDNKIDETSFSFGFFCLLI